jgi:hypothetical protein
MLPNCISIVIILKEKERFYGHMSACACLQSELTSNSISGYKISLVQPN